MKKIIILFVIVFGSCGQQINCDDKIDPTKITWDKIRYADFIDSLKATTKRTSLNGEYINADMSKLLSKLNPKVSSALHNSWDGGALGGIIVKDSIFLFKNYLTTDLCDNIYQDWLSYGLDISMLPQDHIIVQKLEGPNNWYFIRTSKK
jgi:hypothetical protein